MTMSILYGKHAGSQSMNYCSYYQAIIKKELCWYLTAILRSHEHLAFDRTLDVATSTFEFFVPPLLEKEFERVMHQLEHEGVVTGLTKLPNRLLDPSEVV